MADIFVDDIRSVLCENLEYIWLYLIYPIIAAVFLPWKKEEDLLENIYGGIQTSSKASLKLSNLRGKLGLYSLRLNGFKTHRKVYARFQSNSGKETGCELGDILILSKYIDLARLYSRMCCLLQLKVEKKRRSGGWHIDKVQLELFSGWPMLKELYTVKPKEILAKSLKIKPENRFFSSYLFAKRNRIFAFPHICPSFEAMFVSGTDLVRAACLTSHSFHGPLEIPFSTALMQTLFQVSGEYDLLGHVVVNKSLNILVKKLIRHIGMNDPPAGEGRPLIALIFTAERFERLQ